MISELHASMTENYQMIILKQQVDRTTQKEDVELFVNLVVRRKLGNEYCDFKTQNN